MLKDRQGASLEVEPGATAGDYLHGFLLGTRRALSENGRESIDDHDSRLTPRTVGECSSRSTSARSASTPSLVDINAYHQPGVEAGKKAAASVLDLQRKVLAALRERGKAGARRGAGRGGRGPGRGGDGVQVLEQLFANTAHGVARRAGPTPFDALYFAR